MTNKIADVLVIDELSNNDDFGLLDKARNYIANYAMNKLLFYKKTDMFGIYGVSSSGELTDISPLKQQFDLEDLKKIKEIKLKTDLSKSQKTDILKNLIEEIQNVIKKRKYTIKIHFITNCKINENFGNSDINDTLSENKIFVEFILLSQKFNDFYNSIANKFISVSTFRDAIFKAKNERKRSIKHVPKYKGFLNIGNALKISVCCYSKTKVERAPPAKRRRADTKSAIKTISRYYGLFDEDNVIKNDSPDSPYFVKDKIKAFSFGKDIVPFTVFDEEGLESKTEKSFCLLGFVKRDRIDLLPLRMSTSDYVCAQPENERSVLLLAAFVSACRKTNSVAIVRLIKQNKAMPLYGYLSPGINGNERYFVWNELPFREDIKLVTKRDQKFESVTKEQLLKMEEFVDSCEIKSEVKIGFNPVSILIQT
ncbi:ATP-dependent DNA helicase II subunit 2, variant 2 [Bonamia ostreae]|uniref:ATP-dependent DNA helicase II subunit 2, variant 2 n=1 Tax=Bonamia ostreae TaxID=126728 RepID=A0ABV2AI11_9EUKA